jgi:gluconolactonase
MTFARDLAVPEGPVALKDGSWLVVEMAPDRGCVTHIDADGVGRRVIAKTGRPNGLAVDKDGNIWVAESHDPALLKVSMSGDVQVFLTEANGQPFLFPNDLALGPDGALYLTDSGVRFDNFVVDGAIRGDWREYAYDGRVYRIEQDTLKVDVLDRGIKFTNGIAFDADDHLYANETITGNVFRYANLGGGKFGPRELFGNVNDPNGPDGLVGPDGMKFGKDGRLYVTVYAQGDVTVLDKNGTVAERIPTAGKLPTNLAFGLPGDKTIYVTETEHGLLQAIPVNTEGLELYTGEVKT